MRPSAWYGPPIRVNADPSARATSRSISDPDSRATRSCVPRGENATPKSVSGPPIRIRDGPSIEIAVGQTTGHVRGRWDVQGRELDLDRSSSPTTRDVDAGVDGQSMQPGIKAVRVA